MANPAQPTQPQPGAEQIPGGTPIPQQAGGGAAPPPEAGAEYTEDEDMLLTKLTTAAEELLYGDDAHHAAAMKMINESIKIDPPEGLASSTLMTVDQVEKKVTGYDNASGDLPMVTAEGGIPDEVFPGFAISVFDMIWELATVQQDVPLDGHIKQRGMTALMQAIQDRDTLDEVDGQYLMGDMDEDDLNSVMSIMQQGVFDDPAGKESTDTDMAATIEEAKF